MKKLFALFILLNACCLAIYAEQLPKELLESNKNVERYYAGCMKIIEAECDNSGQKNALYKEAMELLNTRKGLSLGIMPVVFTDKSGLVDRRSDFAFDYYYALSKYESKDFNPDSCTRGTGACRTADFIVAPHSSVKCRERVFGNCVLIAVAQPGGTVQLAVTTADGSTIEGKQYENNLVSAASWTMDSNKQVEYKITNTSDKEILVTLIAN